jgi:hypothetical protein
MSTTMATHTLHPCAASRGPRRAIPVRSRIAARVTAAALAIVAVLLMLNGEAWLLARTSDTPDELTVATCAFDAVDPHAGPLKACVTPTMNVDKESL